MSKFYEKLIAERDTLPLYTPMRNFENDVLTQLFAYAFTNNEHPDELPNLFYIRNVIMTKNDLENLLSRLDICANVEIVNDSFFNGLMFAVTLKKSI